jgi:hypothetical protein
LRKESTVVAPVKGTRRRLQKEVSRDANLVSKAEVQPHSEMASEKIQDSTEQPSEINKERSEDENLLINRGNRGRSQDVAEQQSGTVVGRDLDDVPSSSHRRSSSSKSVPIGFVEMPDKL